MTETTRERNARLDNLITRILIAEPAKRPVRIASEVLHGTTASQLADLRSVVNSLSLIVDTLVDKGGTRDEFDAYLLERLVNGPK